MRPGEVEIRAQVEGRNFQRAMYLESDTVSEVVFDLDSDALDAEPTAKRNAETSEGRVNLPGAAEELREREARNKAVSRSEAPVP